MKKCKHHHHVLSPILIAPWLGIFQMFLFYRINWIHLFLGTNILGHQDIQKPSMVARSMILDDTHMSRNNIGLKQPTKCVWTKRKKMGLHRELGLGQVRTISGYFSHHERFTQDISRYNPGLKWVTWGRDSGPGGWMPLHEPTLLMEAVCPNLGWIVMNYAPYFTWNISNLVFYESWINSTGIKSHQHSETRPSALVFVGDTIYHFSNALWVKSKG